jgi:hemerythrin superfamily protein
MTRHGHLQQQGLSGRDVALFAAGAALMFVAARLMPPLAGRALGAARAATGGDPFDVLAGDHRSFLSLLDAMERSEDGATVKRNTLLLRLKRGLAAHALAEEDVIYPLLHDRAEAQESTERLYREHADIKMRLYALEQMDKHDSRWRREVGGLRDLIASHANDEEKVEFPRLRAALSQSATTRLSADMQREKAFIL